MKNFPDHGDGFWALFPQDEEGNTIIDEIDPEKYKDSPRDPELAEFLKTFKPDAR